MMDRYKYVFVVLVYKNIDVLRDFFQTLHILDYKVIVVNSYYDDISLKECQNVAIANNADFIPIENKGFGYGNNVGANFAIEHYEYDYLILSNSDIQIRDLSALSIKPDERAVIAPHVHLMKGKIQNPNIPWRLSCFIPMLHFAYTHNSRIILKISHLMTRFSREVFRIYRKLRKRDKYKIYSCHGSFIIFTKKTVEKLFPFFNERMFLYNEELYLAERCRLSDIPIYYLPQIDILHLEGASSSCKSGVGFANNKQSFEVLYEWLMTKEPNLEIINCD